MSTGVAPSASRIVPVDGRAVTVIVRADELDLATTGAEIAIDVAMLWSETESEVDVAVLPAGSDAVQVAVESAGLNVSPSSSCTVKVSPRATGVMPSANSTVPSEGNAVTVTTKADESKLVSIGAGIAISVVKLFLATVSNLELAVSDMAYSTAEWPATRQSQPRVRSPKEGRPNKPSFAHVANSHELCCLSLSEVAPKGTASESSFGSARPELLLIQRMYTIGLLLSVNLLSQ